MKTTTLLQKGLIAVGAATAIGLGMSAQAQALTLNSIDNGWLDSNGSHQDQNTNIITGNYGSLNYRSFGVFDLSGVTGNILSATLTAIGNNGDYRSTDSSETYSVYDYSGAASALFNSASGSAGQSIYNDLGSGTLLGSSTVVGTDNQSMPAFNIDLSNALNGLNASKGGLWAFGGSCSTCSSDQYLFGFSGQSPAFQLILETEQATPVPTPAAVLPVLGGLLAAARRRKNGEAEEA